MNRDNDILEARVAADQAEASDIVLPLAARPCFIETQFPVAKVSMESYKERTAKQSQTLTGLGKWWGRKPLVLVRAALLGLLMPASDDPVRDREVFLKLMTMDTAGLRARKRASIPTARLLGYLQTMPPSTQRKYLDPQAPAESLRLRKGLKRDDKLMLQSLVFDRMPYAEKLEFCERPEHIEGPAANEWEEINSHLGTHARCLAELVDQLGWMRFGRRPCVGDAFCGGGSVPFEAARLGCDAYGSDLNPVATLLTWAALNIIGGGQDTVDSVRKAQERVYAAVDQQVSEWGIEHNAAGWRADAYLYCVEVVDPESGWLVPLAPSWVIGEKTCTVARLVPDVARKRYEIEIRAGVSPAEMSEARQAGTMKDFRLAPPGGGESTPLEVLRSRMRMWEAEDLTPRPDDVFQERLYCIRWVETYFDADGKPQTRRHYRAPTVEDLHRERQVLRLLLERIEEWQRKGYLPVRRIEPGQDINRPTNARGWTYWHHLYCPRQLLLAGLFNAHATRTRHSVTDAVGLLLSIGRLADWNSRLSRWHPGAANEKSEQIFYKPSLSTPLATFASRTTTSLRTVFFYDIRGNSITTEKLVRLGDARSEIVDCDLWLTDPPYADAVNYHELSELFLSWYDKSLQNIFPDWYTDSRRALAVWGSDDSFRRAMVACYRSLTANMHDNGLQVVMFTHNDTGVWSDLAMILWAAGLRVTAAWTIATETDSTLKQGNYVQGTVLLVLRKRTESEPVFLDEIASEIESEVRRQLDSMLAMEDDSDPNFGDADYQLAAYAAALRVLTARPIFDIDPAKEIHRERTRGDVGPVEQVIRSAVKIACDHLVPRGLDGDLWKSLAPLERFYLKGLEVESHGEYRSGVYQELARGFGAADYTDLLASTRANETRVKSAGEFGRRMLAGSSFGATLLRQVLFAVHQSAKTEETRPGLDYLHTEVNDYWNQRGQIMHLLFYLAQLGRVASMAHWHKDAVAAGLLLGAVRNDHV